MTLMVTLKPRCYDALTRVFKDMTLVKDMTL